MAELVLTKTPTGGLAPADTETAEKIAKLKLGEGYIGKFTRARNIKFHRKIFALFSFAFDNWDCQELEYKGIKAEKNLDRFRKDLTVLAGYYEAYTNIKGELRLNAKSLAFDKMDEDEFQEVYKGILDVVWSRIFQSKGYENPEKVDEIVEKLLSFDR